jgi:hypothetical protein
MASTTDPLAGVAMGYTATANPGAAASIMTGRSPSTEADSTATPSLAAGS